MSIKTKMFLNKLNQGALTFGDMLMSLRMCDAITQTALAKKLKVRKSLICDIEKGRRAVSLKLASKMANIIGYLEQVFIKQVLDDQLKDANLNNLKIKIIKTA